MKNNAAVCRIAFDYDDPALQTLNPHNARALLAFNRVCAREDKNR